MAIYLYYILYFLTYTALNFKIAIMKMIIKKMFAAFLLLSAVAVWADNGVQSVDLSITINTLYEAGMSGRGIPEAGTPVILNGTVIERNVTNAEKETYSAELIMASGRWVDSSEVTVSKCVILLNGPEFSDMVPARRSRTVNPKEIPLNSELLVYGVFLGFADTADGPLAVIQAGGVRNL